MTPEAITNLFAYKTPDEDKLLKFAELRRAAAHFAIVVDRLCPPSPDRTATVRQIQDALMTANRCIANDGESYR